MPKRILLIDSDETFARSLKSALEGRGLAVQVASNSEQGMSLAKSEGPDLIVVCVEAQPTNGYMLCTRLKKDEQLKLVPVILTSANATPDSFEKHKKLKTRAEEYLIKPFEPEALLHRIGALLRIDIPPAAPQAHDDDDAQIISMEDEPLGLGDLVGEDEPVHLTDSEAAEAHAGSPPSSGDDVEIDNVDVEEVISDEESGPAPQGLDEHAPASDEDLDLLDAAFDALSPASRPPPAPLDLTRTGTRIANADDLDPLMGAPPADPEHGAASEDAEVVAEEVPHAGDSEAAAAVAALEARVREVEEALAAKDAELEAAKKGPSAANAAELRKLKEARSKADKENVRLKEELNEKEKELIELRDQQAALEHQAQTLEDDGLKREIAAKALQQRAEALAAAAKKFERELGTAREELKSVAALKARVADAEKTDTALQELQRKHAALLGELEHRQAEGEKVRADAENLAAQHKERASRLEAQLADARMQHENEREQLQGDLEDLRGQLETHKSSAERTQAELQAASAKHAEELAQLGESHAAALAGAKATHEDALAHLAQQHREALAAAEGELALARDAQGKTQAELHAAREASEKAQAELKEARAAAEKLTADLEASQLAGREANGDLAAAKALAEKLGAELEQAQSALAKASQDLSAARDETEKTQLELTGAQEQLEQARAQALRNEQRAVDAYQRIKGDEKLREKTKKALQIALQLLDEVQALPEEDIAIDTGEIEQQQSA